MELQLGCAITLSRYIGVVEIAVPQDHYLTSCRRHRNNANPQRRVGTPANAATEGEEGLRAVASSLGAEFVN